MCIYLRVKNLFSDSHLCFKVTLHYFTIIIYIYIYIYICICVTLCLRTRFCVAKVNGAERKASISREKRSTIIKPVEKSSKRNRGGKMNNGDIRANPLHENMSKQSLISFFLLVNYRILFCGYYYFIIVVYYFFFLFSYSLLLPLSLFVILLITIMQW